MLDVRKKLTSYLPNSARNHLQNVLTVEWGQDNKTVLVDVTGQQDRSDDVELSGLTGNAYAPSRDRSEYGRLDDDDEHDGNGLFNRPTLGKPKTSWTNATLYGTQGSSGTGGRFRSGSAASRKSASGRNGTPAGGVSAADQAFSSSGPYGSSVSGGGDEYDAYDYPSAVRPGGSFGHSRDPGHDAPPVPARPGADTDNPFDENSPTYASGLARADAAFEAEFGRRPSPVPPPRPGAGTSYRQPQQPQQPQKGYGASRSASGRMLPPRLENTLEVGAAGPGYEQGMSGDRGEGSMGPLGDGVGGAIGNGRNDAWGKGGWSEHTSPTSSRGTRGSAQLDDNPFR